MVLQSSGAISLADIAAEFGGTAPHSVNEYYGEDSGIPTSGTISFNQFYGKSAWLWINYIYYPSTGQSYGPNYLKTTIDAAETILTRISVKPGYRVQIWSNYYFGTNANYPGYITGDFDNRSGSSVREWTGLYITYKSARLLNSSNQEVRNF